MARLREIRQRMATVANIQKITRTMERVAHSRSARLAARLAAAREFRERSLEDASALAALCPGSDPLAEPRARLRRVLLVVVTPGRGLCGPVTTRVVEAARSRMAEHARAGVEVRIHVAGRKGAAVFAAAAVPVERMIADLDDRAPFARTLSLAEEITESFLAERVDAVEMVSMRYVNRARQQAGCTALLPIGLSATPRTDRLLVEPSAAEARASAVSLLVAATLHLCLVEAFLSEHMQRTMAMQTASENADEMTVSLTRLYNRTRQERITAEMIEIVGGSQGSRRED